MNEVAKYKIEIKVGNDNIVVVETGYLSLTQKIEQYPFIRVNDVDGHMWSINTRRINCMKITKIADDEFYPR